MKKLFFVIVALVSISCSSSKPSQTKINSLEVSDKLKKGETTQAQVLENFGAPDVVEKTSEGDMWGYNRTASENESVGGGVSHYLTSAALWNFTGMGINGDKSSSSTKTASLILHFNGKKILRNYAYRTEKY